MELDFLGMYPVLTVIVNKIEPEERHQTSYSKTQYLTVSILFPNLSN